jgi:pSer/pThr/pTyr-binding forkhead associated (FHA) protein
MRKTFLYIMNGYEEGRLIELKEGNSRIGRSEDVEKDGKVNAIILPYDDKISRVHAMIEYSQEELTIKDLGSTHGTKVNQAKIAGKKRLVIGDSVIMGKTLMLVCDSVNILSVFEMKEAVIN